MKGRTPTFPTLCPLTQQYVSASVLLPGVVLQEELCILRAMQPMPQYLAERRKKWQGKEENEELESNVLKFPLHMISQALRATFVSLSAGLK